MSFLLTLAARRRRSPVVLGIVMLALVLAVMLWPAPSPVSATGAATISADSAHTCVVTGVGGVLCWGSNNVGQLGDGQSCGNVFCPAPAAVSGLTSGVAVLDTGSAHTCAVTTESGVLCWGSNIFGLLGTVTTELCPTTPCGTTPLEVLGLGPKPTPTSTPVPPPTAIGGIGIFPGALGSGPDSGSTALLTWLAAVAAGAFALGGAAWYAKRRRHPAP